MAGAAIDPSRLDVLRALADPTRNRLYRELQRSAGPLTTPELASRVTLHPNTVRAHLDQLCAAGLVRADTTGHGGRGRPRHRFSALPSHVATATATATREPVDDPGTDRAAAGLARALVQVAEVAGVEVEVIRSVGRRSGADRVAPSSAPGSPAEAVERVVDAEAADGYEPVPEELAPGRWRLTFSTCPFRQLADEAPEVVCSLHAGSLEGICGATGRLLVESFDAAGPGELCQAVLREQHR